MKSLAIILLTILNVTGNVSCQHIKGKNFEGYVFDQEHPALVSVENQKSRYTPSKDDILKAEELLAEGIEQINNPLVNQGGKCPILHKNLKKYVRQYLGFVNNEGQKIIWINLLWKKEEGLQERASKDIVTVLDGCSHYWKIKVNLTTGKLLDLDINGSA